MKEEFDIFALVSGVYNLAKITEAERNMREIRQELCCREHQRQRPARIV